METMGLEKGAPERGIIGHRCGDKQNSKNGGGTLFGKRERRAILRERGERGKRKTKGD